MKEPKTVAQAETAAEAVNEARMELARYAPSEKGDRALYHLEMLYWRKADELKAAKEKRDD